MSVNESLSEELNKSYDSSNLAYDITEKEEKSSSFQEEKTPKKRKISKISLKLEEMKDKINSINEKDFEASTDDIDADLEFDEIPLLSKSTEYLKKENIFYKYNIYFSFLFDKKEFSVSIESGVFNIYKNNVQDLIKNIINKINEKNIIIQNNKINYILSLKDSDEQDFYKNNYELRNYKKDEYIIYSSDLLLSEIKETKLNFVTKNYLNIMIRKI